MVLGGRGLVLLSDVSGEVSKTLAFAGAVWALGVHEVGVVLLPEVFKEVVLAVPDLHCDRQHIEQPIQHS